MTMRQAEPAPRPAAASLGRRRLAPFAPPLVSIVLGVTLHALLRTPTPAADSRTYNAIAAGLVGKHAGYGNLFDLHWAAGGLAVRGVGYPILVALGYLLTGGVHPSAIGWFQACVMLPATTALIYLAGREAFGRRAGLVAAWLFALWFPAVWHTEWLLTETMLDLLMAALLFSLAAAVNRRSRRFALTAGLLAGALAISHSAYQFLPIVLVIVVLLHLRHYDRPNMRLAGHLTIGILVLLAPFVVTTTLAGRGQLGQGGKGYGGGGGWTFYVASRVETNFIPINDDFQIGDLNSPGRLVRVGQLIDEGKIHVEPHLRAIIRRKLSRADPEHETLTDGDYYRAGIENLLDHPGDWPAKLRLNATNLFLVPPQLQFYGPDPAPSARWFRGWWRPLSGLLAVAAAVGFVIVLVRRRGRLFLFVPALAQACLLMPTLVEWRYVIPLWSTLFVLAGLAMCAASGRARRLGAHFSAIRVERGHGHRRTRIVVARPNGEKRGRAPAAP